MASPNPPPPTSTPTPITTQPQPQPPSSQTPSPTQPPLAPNANPYIHNIALAITPLSLLALFLPPRKLDVRAVVLGGVTLWGTNQLVYDYSGRSSMQRFGHRVAQMGGTELPEGAKVTQMRLRQERERMRAAGVGTGVGGSGVGVASGGSAGGLGSVGKMELTAEQRRFFEEQEQTRRLNGTAGAASQNAQDKDGKDGEEKRGVTGVLDKIWMGDETPDWKEKRDRREKKALSEGGDGIWGLITEQIWEVWNQGGKTKTKTGEEDNGAVAAAAAKSNAGESGEKKS
ncbi:Uu.00g093660.m01.CDS01 [Anthostomella pinea]|uniref:Uu.00g093660.m01.CDS01 n=1 Tax=Anthostomella pinea TaxID=933095 RepID=A0AAI8VNI5_9PEZI|nr:Uu.00g093660.m01.CDS01 [Anthostomella pinea]